jgi:hypothetical protein
MSLKLSVGEMLDNLERKIALHREQAALHAREEELHRGQRVLHEAELETATRYFEALRAAAVPAAEMALHPPSAEPAVPTTTEASTDDAQAGLHPRLNDFISRILESRSGGEPFGPTAMTEEINRRFRSRLDKEADVRSVSAALRRMSRKHQVHLVREGRAYSEALYAKGPEPRRGQR